jgi:ParB-like chromosome segregation protein Spo0J
VQALSINQIKLNPRNPRTHSAKQIRQIANSIVAFGFTNPLLVSPARAATRRHSYSAWRRCR